MGYNIIVVNVVCALSGPLLAAFGVGSTESGFFIFLAFTAGLFLFWQLFPIPGL